MQECTRAFSGFPVQESSALSALPALLVIPALPALLLPLLWPLSCIYHSMFPSSKVTRFEDLIVFQKAMVLSEEIYRVTSDGKFVKDWGLREQIRRASVSILSNIAEGFGRYEPRDKTRFYKISRGSAYEVMSQIMASFALDFFTVEADKDFLIAEYRNVISELDSLIKTIETNG